MRDARKDLSLVLEISLSAFGRRHNPGIESTRRRSATRFRSARKRKKERGVRREKFAWVNFEISFRGFFLVTRGANARESRTVTLNEYVSIGNTRIRVQIITAPALPVARSGARERRTNFRGRTRERFSNSTNVYAFRKNKFTIISRAPSPPPSHHHPLSLASRAYAFAYTRFPFVLSRLNLYARYIREYDEK